jgi:hypothetical protein
MDILSNFATQFKSKRDFGFNILEIKSLRLISGEAMFGWLMFRRF